MIKILPTTMIKIPVKLFFVYGMKYGLKFIVLANPGILESLVEDLLIIFYLLNCLHAFVENELFTFV